MRTFAFVAILGLSSAVKIEGVSELPTADVTKQTTIVEMLNMLKSSPYLQGGLTEPYIERHLRG